MQMRSDISALKQQGAHFGIDCDPIRATLAYQNQLEVLFAEGYDASAPHASCSSSSDRFLPSQSLADAAISSGFASHGPQGCQSLQIPFASTSDASHGAAITSGSQFCVGVPDLQSSQVGAPLAVRTGVNPEGNDSDVGRLAKRHRPR